jgi:hypothetical protein
MLRAQPGSPYANRNPAYNLSGSSSGGGGGGQVRSIISSWRDRLLGNMYPGGGGGGGGYSSGGYSSYSYPSYESSSTFTEPGMPKMSGKWGKGIDPEQAQGLYYQPSLMMPKVSNVSADAPFGDYVRGLPMAQLVLMSAGKKIPAPKTDAYGNLTSQDKSLSAYTNQLAKTYSGILNKDKWFDYDQMAGNLMHAKGNSALGAQIENQPAATQASTVLSNVSALLSATVDPRVASSQTDYAQSLIDKWGSKSLSQSPSKAPNLARKIGRKVFYS